MIYIKKLRLQNFQTHKDTTLEFDSGFNCIVGATRTGKSSVVRALNFLLYNNWYSEYQRFNTFSTVVTADLSNGVKIARVKGDKLNQILLTTPAGVKKFENFGTSLPKEVIDCLGVFPVEVDSDTLLETNVADQDDPMFLLYNTGSDRTKILSRLSGLHWLDFSLQDLNKDRKTLSSEFESLASSNGVLRVKIEGFKNLDTLSEDLKYQKEILEKVKELVKVHDRFSSLLDRINKWKISHTNFKKIKDFNFKEVTHRFSSLVNIYDNTYLELQEKMYRIETINSSLKNLKDNLDSINYSKNRLEHQITEEEAKGDFCPTCGAPLKASVQEN